MSLPYPRFVAPVWVLALALAMLCAAPISVAADEGKPASYIPHDLDPTLEVFKAGDRWLSLGASSQIWTLPFVQDEALVANGDPANEVGFRLRRVRLGAQGGLNKNVTFNLTLNPLGAGDSLVHNVRMTWHASAAAAISLGTGKVPYSRTATESSSSLHFYDRPLGTGEMTIGHRLGLTVEGSLWDGALGYVAGVYNATDGLADGNQAAGLLYGGRLESMPLGALSGLKRGGFRAQLGFGAIFEDGPTVDTLAYSGDALVEYWGVRVRGEILIDQREPDSQPELPASLPARVERTAIVGEATALIIEDTLEIGVRYEWYDNNRASEDFGDQQILVGGITYYAIGHRLKAFANFIHRDEREGRDIDNNAVVIGLAGAL